MGPVTGPVRAPYGPRTGHERGPMGRRLGCYEIEKAYLRRHVARHDAIQGPRDYSLSTVGGK